MRGRLAPARDVAHRGAVGASKIRLRPHHRSLLEDSVRRALRCLAVLLLACAAGRPAPAGAQIPRAEYGMRRDALLARIDSGVVVAYGGVEPVNYWPTFFQLPSFQYLTGFGEPDAVLVLVKRGGTGTAAPAGTGPGTAMLFVPPRNLMVEKFVGARTGPTEVMGVVGLAGRAMPELRGALDSLLAGGLPLYVVSDVQTTDYTEADTLTRGARLIADLKRGRPTLVVHALDSVVHALRARKSAGEIALLRRAVSVSATAHRDAMAAVAPGCTEGEVQALMEGTFKRLGGDRPGYGSIVGSGPNALVLHYMANTRTLRPGELVLIDAGTSFEHYSADVTRTLPVSGRFTAPQRAIYQLVLDAQAAFVRQIRPGSAVATANDSGHAVITRGLTRLGLLESPDATFDPPPGMRCPPTGCAQVGLFALHGYGGHGIGLEVHDPAQYYTGTRTFQPGDVFTVEPGLYIGASSVAGLPDTPRNRAMLTRMRPVIDRYRDIGVRIEDDYAVTARGVDWLSSGVPREPAEVEALMRRRASGASPSVAGACAGAGRTVSVGR
jgi:Xaa-Pro aminopeptidase